MKKSFLTIICLVAAFTANQGFASGDAAAGTSKVAMCAGCHGNDGNSMVSSFPKLAGLGEKYLYRQLLNIQSGERVIVEMTGLLDASSDQDLQDMAAYYDGQQRQISGAQEITLIGYSDPDEALELGENIYRGGNLQTGVPSCTGSILRLVQAMIRRVIPHLAVSMQAILRASYLSTKVVSAPAVPTPRLCRASPRD